MPSCCCASLMHWPAGAQAAGRETRGGLSAGSGRWRRRRQGSLQVSRSASHCPRQPLQLSHRAPLRQASAGGDRSTPEMPKSRESRLRPRYFSRHARPSCSSIKDDSRANEVPEALRNEGAAQHAVQTAIPSSKWRRAEQAVIPDCRKAGSARTADFSIATIISACAYLQAGSVRLRAPVP